MGSYATRQSIQRRIDPSRAPHSEASLYIVGVEVAEWFAMYPIEKSSISSAISRSRN